jgi:sRNA-binding carbon storage regulator CsrA
MGKGVSILVIQVRGKQVRLVIIFAPDILVLRGELYERGKPLALIRLLARI